MATNGSEDNNQEKPAPATEKDQQPKDQKMMTIPEADLQQLKKEVTEYKDKYLRSIAEAENLKKRLHKERHDMTQLALQSIMVDFLDPIDHLENALSFTGNMGDEVKNWAIGFKMILNQFKEVLAANDVHPFKSVGMPFDPHNHEAVEMVETSEYGPGTVIEESIRGYKMGSKTIRPARVKVSKAPGKSNVNEQQPEDVDSSDQKKI